jgi:hypothetical protein
VHGRLPTRHRPPLAPSLPHKLFNRTNGAASIWYLLKHPFKGHANLHTCLVDLNDSVGPHDEILRFQVMGGSQRIRGRLALAGLPHRDGHIQRAIHQSTVAQQQACTAAGRHHRRGRSLGYHTDVDKWFARPPGLRECPFSTPRRTSCHEATERLSP